MATERSQLTQVAPEANAAPKADRKSKKRSKVVLPPWVIRIMAWLTLLTAWEMYGRNINPVLFTYPTAVARNFVRFIENGELFQAALPTLQIIAGGLFFAILIAIPFGVIMARFRYVDNWFDTYIAYLYATPSVALVPVVVLWAGIYLKAKIIMKYNKGFSKEQASKTYDTLVAGKNWPKNEGVSKEIVEYTINTQVELKLLKLDDPSKKPKFEDVFYPNIVNKVLKELGRDGTNDL